MRETHYGDKLDLLKWGALARIAKDEGIADIVQVAFLQESGEAQKPTLYCGKKPDRLFPEEVWKHFRCLCNIESLGPRLRLRITVVDRTFRRSEWNDYLNKVKSAFLKVSGRKIVLLDPDTGIKEGRNKEEHVTWEETQQIWQALTPSDWLVLYQHKPRKTEEKWENERRKLFVKACDGASVKTFSAEHPSGKGGKSVLPARLYAIKKP